MATSILKGLPWYTAVMLDDVNVIVSGIIYYLQPMV